MTARELLEEALARLAPVIGELSEGEQDVALAIALDWETDLLAALDELGRYGALEEAA